MDQFNLGNFLNKFAANYSLPNMKGGPAAGPNGAPEAKFAFPTDGSAPGGLIPKAATNTRTLLNFDSTFLTNLKMNELASFEKSLYYKDLMNLPKEIEQVLVILQNKEVAKEELSQLLTTNINLLQLSELIKQGSKDATSKLIMAMANASKQGITDLSQIKEALKFINASVSVAGQDNSSQILKTFMLLYLPWLPLQEGVDFDLEIEGSKNEEDEEETTVTINISTRHYGNVKVLLILVKGNSITLFINCSEEFPKEELLKRLNIESKNHSIQSTIAFENVKTKKAEDAPRQAKISMSNLKEVNPSLLLMSNAVIKNTIELDNLAD